MKITNLLTDLWATGCTNKVAEGVLNAEFIWGENLNLIPGLTEKIVYYLNSIQEKGMIHVVKEVVNE